MLNHLQKSWEDLASPYFIHEKEVSGAYNDLVARYTESHRKYHSLTHLEDFLLKANNHQERFDDFAIIRFAIWYHDAVYVPWRFDNEMQSKKLADKWLSKTKLSLVDQGKIGALILATQSHDVDPAAADIDTLLFLDLDMSILGSEPEQYASYVHRVRAEFGMIPKPVFDLNRKKFLKKLLSKTRIFLSTDGHDLYEEQARRNITDELSGTIY